MSEHDVMLNELARELPPMPQDIERYDTLKPRAQSKTVLLLRRDCIQARHHGRRSGSIRRARLRPTNAAPWSRTSGVQP